MAANARPEDGAGIHPDLHHGREWLQTVFECQYNEWRVETVFLLREIQLEFSSLLYPDDGSNGETA
jgi:hypothetical protein